MEIISCSHVNFAYPGCEEDVLKDVSLHPAFRIRGALRQIRVRQEHLAAASEKESNAIRKTGGAHSVLR